ncbi:phosphoglycerate kinase [Mycoplasma phocoenae]|uniref:Phosphoglycerate kinase n=1 Tax=Mycoplasma phocoenae TaxID=754517 RepID=A0A858U5Q7_9MOLU|nr:phosphoglycerate kinase [Mycoplasma phocoenae]QJG66767.1 phosphoglycerate kinase [Mycoplasma phocoenae]
MKKTIKDIDLTNKKVLLRVDFNVPLVSNDDKLIVADDNRILAALPTIKYILKQNAKLIILSHLSRIKTKEDLKSKSLKPVVECFKKFVNNKVTFIEKTTGDEIKKFIDQMENNEILFIENTRFMDLENKAESKKNDELSKYWASLGDVFINDAFGITHRAHASNAGIAENIKESAIGFLVENEIEHLNKLKNPARPYLAIIGGAKISDKIQVLETLLNKADKVLIGGAMAYTFNLARNVKIGKSLSEPEYVALAKKLLEKYKDKIVLPCDNAISKTFTNSVPLYTNAIDSHIDDNYEGMDIGKETIREFSNIIANAKTIFWNGPLGVCEFENYSKGTEQIAIAIAKNEDAYSIVGGGDSVAAIKKLHYENKFSFISTGGGASLEYIQNKQMPGIDSIQDK